MKHRTTTREALLYCLSSDHSPVSGHSASRTMDDKELCQFYDCLGGCLAQKQAMLKGGTGSFH